jgi:hypothetical protein
MVHDFLDGFGHSSMAEVHRWMYEGWKKIWAISSEWVTKADDFLDRAFGRSEIRTDVRCPCSKCRDILFP